MQVGSTIIGQFLMQSSGQKASHLKEMLAPLLAVVVAHTMFCCIAQDLVESVSDMSKANDWFLVAPDFTDYMRAQVCSLQQCNACSSSAGTSSICAYSVSLLPWLLMFITAIGVCLESRPDSITYDEC
jgi:hypothetical protein